MRRHKDPKRKTTQAQKTTQAEDAQAEDNSSTEDPRNPDSRHKRGGTAPDMGRCTRYVAVHPNRRGALPTDRVQRPNTQEQTRNWHTEPLTATPLHAHLDHTGGRMGTPPTPPPALRPTPAHSDTSYTLTCEEPVNLRAGGSRAPPDWPTTRSVGTNSSTHAATPGTAPTNVFCLIALGFPTSPIVARVCRNPLHKEAGGVHSCATGMLFLRVRGCGVDAPPFVFPRSESNVFSQAAMILTSRWRCGHSSMSRA